MASSPGAMTARRFFRNRLAVTGLVILGILFVFSFLGGGIVSILIYTFFFFQLFLYNYLVLRLNQNILFVVPLHFLSFVFVLA